MIIFLVMRNIKILASAKPSPVILMLVEDMAELSHMML